MTQEKNAAPTPKKPTPKKPAPESESKQPEVDEAELARLAQADAEAQAQREAEASAAEVDKAAAPNLVDIFAGKDSAGVIVRPRIMLNVVAQEVNDVPDVVKVGDTFYSVSSPMRKGDGSKDNAAGLIRKPLVNLASYLSSLSGREVVFFGGSQELEQNIGNLMNHLTEKAIAIMAEPFGGTENAEFRFLKPTSPVSASSSEDEEDEDLDGIGVTEIEAASAPEWATASVSESFEIDTWPVFSSVEDEFIFCPTICITARVPVLVGREDLVKPLSQIRKILANIAKKYEMAEDDVRLSFSFNAEEMLEVSLLTLLTEMAEDDNAALVSTSYLEACAEDIDQDVYTVYPMGANAHEAQRCLMPYGGNVMLLL